MPALRATSAPGASPLSFGCEGFFGERDAERRRWRGGRRRRLDSRKCGLRPRCMGRCGISRLRDQPRGRICAIRYGARDGCAARSQRKHHGRKCAVPRRRLAPRRLRSRCLDRPQAHLRRRAARLRERRQRVESRYQLSQRRRFRKSDSLVPVHRSGSREARCRRRVSVILGIPRRGADLERGADAGINPERL